MTDDYHARFDGWYWERFFTLCADSPSYRHAWQRLEAEHLERFGFFRYTDYDHFRSCKTRKFKSPAPSQPTLFD